MTGPAIAAPGAGAQPAPASQPAAPAVSAPAAHPDWMEDGAAAAAALHGAIVVRDWPTAADRAIAVRENLTNALAHVQHAGLRRRLTRLRAMALGVERAVTRRDFVHANTGAYQLVTGMLGALTAMASTQSSGGGGGGGAANAGANAAPVDYLREAYPEVLKAHASLLRGDATQAKEHLDTVRERLGAARKAGAVPVLDARIDDLNKRRWRIVASLNDPGKAAANSTALGVAYARVMWAAGSAGGGGGYAGRRWRPRASQPAGAVVRPQAAPPAYVPRTQVPAKPPAAAPRAQVKPTVRPMIPATAPRLPAPRVVQPLPAVPARPLAPAVAPRLPAPAPMRPAPVAPVVPGAGNGRPLVVPIPGMPDRLNAPVQPAAPTRLAPTPYRPRMTLPATVPGMAATPAPAVEDTTPRSQPDHARPERGSTVDDQVPYDKQRPAH